MGKHNIRESDTIIQMHDTDTRLIGGNLLYSDVGGLAEARDIGFEPRF